LTSLASAVVGTKEGRNSCLFFALTFAITVDLKNHYSSQASNIIHPKNHQLNAREVMLTASKGKKFSRLWRSG
jgi:hypothetical protein